MNAIDMCKDAVQLSFRLKEMGHHLMIDISQHVDWMSMRLFIGGWAKDDNEEGDLKAYIEFGDMPAYNRFKDDLLSLLLEKVKGELLADETEQKIQFQNENNN